MLKARLLSTQLRRKTRIAEAVLAGVLENIEPSDPIVSSDKDPLLEVLRGADASLFTRLKLTSADDPQVAHSDRTISAGPLNAAGIALGVASALKRAQSSAVTVTILPGKLTRGAAWEQAIKYAGEQHLPIIFVSDSTTVGGSQSKEGRHVSHWPCPTIFVDGRDVIAVYRVSKEAIAAARRGYGPTLVDCVNFLAPGTRGRDGRDPLASFRGYLKRHNAWSDEWAADLESRLTRELGHVQG
jgi:pyruvate dehydrogenase E1 component alpha subunit